MAGQVIRAADRLRWASGTLRQEVWWARPERDTRRNARRPEPVEASPHRVGTPVNGGRRHRAPPRRDGTGRSGRPPPCASASPSAPGSGGRATTRPLERLTPRPAAEQPGRLRPRAAWAGWASAASPLRLPRPRPDTTVAWAGGPASPAGERGPHPHASAWQRQPPRRVGGAGAKGVGGAPRYREAAPVETAGTGRVRRVSPQRRRGSPLGERRQACLRERRGVGAA